MFIDDVGRAGLRMPSTRTRVLLAVAAIAVLLLVLQVAASRGGFQGPLQSLVSDYVATPKSITVPWVGLGVAMVGLSVRWRVVALSSAAVLDVLFAAGRLLSGGGFTFGNGPMIVLTAVTVLIWRRLRGVQRVNALRGVAFGFLLILATKVGDTWLRITAIVRPNVWDTYALLADHALAQPSWLMGRVVDAAGPVLSGLLHWVYIELPAAAMVVALYQLRNVTRDGWPHHFLMRTFLVLGLVGPVIYVLFPLVGPAYAFGSAGQGFQVGDFWPHTLPPIVLSPNPIPFDDLVPRNCMPSMHTAWALALFIHSREGPRLMRWAGRLWLTGTLAATLGFGYHYGVDLVAGAVLCMTVESGLREPVRGGMGSRISLMATGASFLAVLVVSCRYLAEPMARFPLLFGPLIIGALVVFSSAFYAMFFSRAPLDISLARAGAHGQQVQPEYG